MNQLTSQWASVIFTWFLNSGIMIVNFGQPEVSHTEHSSKHFLRKTQERLYSHVTKVAITSISESYT